MRSLIWVFYACLFVGVSVWIQFALNIVLSARQRRAVVSGRLGFKEKTPVVQSEVGSIVKRHDFGHDGSGLVAGLNATVDTYLRQAGINKTAKEVYGAILICIFVVSSIAMLVGHNFLFKNIIIGPLAIALLSSILVFATAAYAVVRKRRARISALEEQMPLALDVVVRALRAGHPVISAVQLAAREIGDPVGREFALVADETTYGGDFRDALTHFASRTGSSDAHFFSVSVGIQAETGGNLVEALEGLAQVIRSRLLLAKRIKALSAEGRASAKLLSVLPVLLISFLLVLHPEFYISKFNDPIFWRGACIVGILYALGLFMIRRITRFRY